VTAKEDSLQFSTEIEEIAREKRLSYIDAILHYCDATGLEVELVNKLVNKQLKEKVQVEAEELNFLKK